MPGKQIVVLGIGNLLCRDDGIGIHVVHAMQSSGKHADVDIIDGGTSPDIISLLDTNVKKLILIDALKCNGQPGDVYRFTLQEDDIADDQPATLHGLSVLDSLKVMKKLGLPLPDITLIGVEPANTSHGLHLSAQLEAAIPEVIHALHNEIILCSNNGLIK
jgi:hydrogenase maturation protease